MDYIYKNYPVGYTTTYTGDGVMSFYVYKEKYESQNWATIDSTKQILGYTCQLATCNFRGRTFFAWFTTDIPISEGPWKFTGLPGLILEAYDKSKDYHYTIKGIKQSNIRPVEIYSFGGKRYEKTDRLTFLKAKSDLWFGNRNAMDEVEAETGIKIGSGTSISSSKKRKAYDFIERDYH